MWLGVIANLISSAILFAVGLFWRKITFLSPNRRKFKEFFGKNSIMGEKLYLVYDEYSTRRDDPNSPFEFSKDFIYRNPWGLVGADKVTSVSSVRAIIYLQRLFANLTYKQAAIDTDQNFYSKWEGTFICIGGPASNSKTLEIQHLPQNKFYHFDQATIVNRKTNKIIKNEGGHPHDFGLILKLKNPIFEKFTLFIIAGIGEWGTSCAGYYLYKNWKNLYKKFGTKDFGIVIKIRPGSDEYCEEYDVEIEGS